MTREDDKGDQPICGETTWTNTGVTRYGRGQHKTGPFGDDMLRPSPNHGTQRLPNDDDDDERFAPRYTIRCPCRFRKQMAHACLCVMLRK